jgi:hypothetical protein
VDLPVRFRVEGGLQPETSRLLVRSRDSAEQRETDDADDDEHDGKEIH